MKNDSLSGLQLILIASSIIFSLCISLPAFASDAITVKYQDKTFDVNAKLTNGDVKSIKVDPDFKSIILAVETTGTQTGELTITLPRGLIDAKKGTADDEFIIVVGADEVNYKETNTTDNERELKISIPAGTKEVEIVGTQIIPEFPISVIGAMAAIIGAVVLLGRMKLRFR